MEYFSLSIWNIPDVEFIAHNLLCQVESAKGGYGLGGPTGSMNG
jgi:hypothetical protein